MTKIRWIGGLVVVTHALVTILHGWAHAMIPVPTTAAQATFIAAVIAIAPVVAAVLLWTPFRRAGVRLLLGSMLGSLLFGVYYHFIAEGADHVSRVPADEWGWLFQATAVLLMVTEGVGTLVGAWALAALRPAREIHLRRATAA
jgi:hypothetical protein